LIHWRRSSMSDKETLGEGRRQIGMKLRAAREEAEMDLADLSVRTGFSEEEIEAIENGEQMIYQTDLMVLCTALNVSPNDIVGRSTN
jgi:transcriptional regulator with XRE-family HTH domain